MIADASSLPVSALSNAASPGNTLSRILLRLLYAYIFFYALYALTNVAAFLAVPFTHGKFTFPVDEAFRGIVPWVGVHLLHIHQPITYALSGDSPFSWIEQLLFLLIAFVAALVWAAVDRLTHRSRRSFKTIDLWLRVLVRFSLATIFFAYGFDKVYPIQFHFITRADLVTPLGELDHFSLMWHFMAASKPYTIFSGVLEVLAGVLLLLPPLTNLGALVSVIVLTNVVALNFAYNIPVKLHSSNYLLLAVFLSAPLAPRLYRLLVLNRDTPGERVVPLSNDPRHARIIRLVPVAVGALIFVAFLFEQRAHYLSVEKIAATAVPLQGIWQVDQFTFPGGEQKPLLTTKLAEEMHIPAGEDRWLRLVFDRPKGVIIQALNGKLDYVNLDLHSSGTAGKTAILTDTGDKNWKGSLAIDQLQANQMHIRGQVNGTLIDASLHRLDENNFPIMDNALHLVNR